MDKNVQWLKKFIDLEKDINLFVALEAIVIFLRAFCVQGRSEVQAFTLGGPLFNRSWNMLK